LLFNVTDFGVKRKTGSLIPFDQCANNRVLKVVFRALSGATCFLFAQMIYLKSGASPA